MDYSPSAQTPGVFSAAMVGSPNILGESFPEEQQLYHEQESFTNWSADSKDSVASQSHHSYPSPPSATMTYSNQVFPSFDFDNDHTFFDHLSSEPNGQQHEVQEKTYDIESYQFTDHTIFSNGSFTPVSELSFSLQANGAQPEPGSQQKSKQPPKLQLAQRAINEANSNDSSEYLKQTLAQEAKKRTRTRKRNPPTEEQERAKRERLLERNRIAASKCRQKRKSYTSSLEESARELQSRRDSLSALANSLKDEMLFLKGQMLRHSDCGCTRVREYLHNEANALACSKNPSLMSDATRARSSSIYSASASSTTETASPTQWASSVVFDTVTDEN